MTQPKKKTTPARKTKTNPSENLRERVLDDAQTLKVPLSAEMLDAALARADQEGLSHLNFLELIFGEPAARSRQRAIERRIREAKFRDDKNLDGLRLEVQWPGDRPCPDRAVGHRRVPSPPREPRDGGTKRRRKKPSLTGAGPPLL